MSRQLHSQVFLGSQLGLGSRCWKSNGLLERSTTPAQWPILLRPKIGDSVVASSSRAWARRSHPPVEIMFKASSVPRTHANVPPGINVLLCGCQNTLLLCRETGLKTIAFPAISCGVYGYPQHEAAKVRIEYPIQF